MSQLKNKRILIFQQRGWSMVIGHFLAKKLQAEGCRLAALTLKRSAHEYLINQPEVKYDLTINDDEVMGDPKKFLGGDDYSLKEICDSLGVDSIWPLAASLRNHVRSYKIKYYYSFRQNMPDEDIIEYIKAVYKYIKIFFNQFKPDLIITPDFVVLPHLMLNLYAEKRGIKMIAITDCKIKDYCMFTYDFNKTKGPFYERVDALNNNSAKSKNLAKADNYIEEFRKKFKMPDYTDKYAMYIKRSLKQKIRHLLSPYYHIWRWYTQKHVDYIKNIGITADYKPPKIILRDHYCHDKYSKYLEKYNFYPFDKIKKFAYFPLQFQPEATTDVIAPYFSNQIETIRLIAMSLPDDYTLAVKEHPAMQGYRAPSYIKKVDKTPNVKFIDFRIPTDEILKRTSLVINHNCTTFAEAAFYKKPAIQLGNLGTTLKLPNVFKHTDMTTISAKIKETLRIDLNNEEYERRLRNYVAAVYDTGFEFNHRGVWLEGKQGDMDFFWQKCRQEIERVLGNKNLCS